MGTVHRVLLAEDDDALRDDLARALRGDGFEVIEARNGAELVEQLTRQPAVQLVVSGARMPWHSGISVLAALRKACWSIPFILVTVLGDEQCRSEAARWNATVLTKPLAPEELRRAAGSLVTPPCRGR